MALLLCICLVLLLVRCKFVAAASPPHLQCFSQLNKPHKGMQRTQATSFHKFDDISEGPIQPVVVDMLRRCSTCCHVVVNVVVDVVDVEML